MVLKRGYEEIDNFLKSWEKEGRENLQDIIKGLENPVSLLFLSHGKFE